MLSVFPGWNANAGRENILKSADAVHFFNRRFEQTFHGYSDESSAKELSREKKTERVAAHRREGGGGVSHDTRTNFQPTSTLTFPYDLLTGLEESEGRVRNYVVISASGEIIGLTPGKNGRILRRLKNYTNQRQPLKETFRVSTRLVDDLPCNV